MFEHPLGYFCALTVVVYYYVQIFHPQEVSAGRQRVPAPHHRNGPAPREGNAWNKNLCSVGQPLLDTEHARIFAYLDDLSAALACHSDVADVERLWRGLVDCTDAHFMDEERVMREHSFPEIAEHQKLHEQLRTRTLGLGLAVRLVTGRNALGYLRTCWSSHIRTRDMEYSPYLVWDGAVHCN
jgi:hemerythrin